VRRRGDGRAPGPDDDRTVRETATSVVARHVRVSGRVQGVFFRSETRRTARRFGVVGWVRNDADGSVEVWLEGEGSAVDAVEAWVRAGGPPAAVVHDVAVRTVAPEGHGRFEVRG
jgi:acylphosphatase